MFTANSNQGGITNRIGRKIYLKYLCEPFCCQTEFGSASGMFGGELDVTVLHFLEGRMSRSCMSKACC